MIPKAYYALFLLLFFCASLTANDALTSPGPKPFNVSLREAGGKSTALSVAGCPLSVATANQPPPTTFKVVLDAGHGGKDPGGMGKNSREKYIVLNIARLLAIGIRTNFPNVEVIMTRSDDTFIPLYERAKIANEEGADLFISIHANIMPGSSATYGTETFVMGQHVAEHNLAVAKRENASILLEDNVKENYGYDPNSVEGHIMMSTFQHAFLERSILFADLVEGEFTAAGRKSRGVKQAGFAVLKNTTMPSVLVETGFMSNPDEEAYLLSSAGQQKLANALLKAFNGYLKMMGGSNARPLNPATSTFPTPQASPTTPPGFQPRQPVTAPADPAGSYRPPATSGSVFDREITPGQIPLRAPSPAPSRQWTAKGIDPQPITYYPSPPAAPAAIPRAQTVAYGTPLPSPSERPLPPRSAASKEFESVLSREVTFGLRTMPSVYQHASRAAPAVAYVHQDTVPSPGTYKFGQAQVRQDKNRLDLSTVPDAELVYAVQVIATKRILDLTETRWQLISYPVRMVREGEWNKYQVRGLSSPTEAQKAREMVKNAGFREAMIVVYYQGQRIAPAQVNYLLSR